MTRGPDHRGHPGGRVPGLRPVHVRDLHRSGAHPEPAGDVRPPVAGLLLAAGQGRRMGTPKALLRDPDGTPWVARAVRTLLAGGCREAIVVVGAAAEQVIPLVPPPARVVVAIDWAEGMGASLRAGLEELADPGRFRVPGPPGTAEAPGTETFRGTAGAPGTPVAALVGLVDLSGITPQVVERLVAVAGRGRLARAGYHGRPGHPVLLGRDHWEGLRRRAHGDAGARGYLVDHRVPLVECSDVGHGDDADVPADLAPPG